MAISGGDGSIILSTKIDTSGINKGMTSIKNIVGQVGSIIAIAFSTRTLINFGKEAINLASDLEEVQNVVDVAFGSMAYRMEEFADTALETYGISKLTAKRTASTYMAMAKGMGIAEEAGAEMALTLTGLTADMASFYNVSQEMADTAIKSVFTGETESLKQYGIVMTEVNLEQFALSQGITKSLSAMTQQEKTMLRYNYILQQTALAQGDFVRTQDSWANQTRILQERWKEMQAAFGQTFIAVGTLILPAVNTIISAMTKLAQITSIAAQNIYKFFTGKNLQFSSGTNSGTGAITETTNGITDLGKESENASDEVSDLGDATEEAGKQAKKSLAGFDDLQILASSLSNNIDSATNNMDDLNGSIDGIGDLSGNITETGEEIDYMKQAEKIEEALIFIMGAVGAALAAIGIALLLSGQVGWGIGFIIAGAAIFGVSAASLISEDISEKAEIALSALMGIAGGALAAIGIFLIVSGSIAWGIGFVIAGAAVLNVGMATITEFGTDAVEQKLMYIQGIAAGAMLALGIILLMFTGATPLSIGLIVGGVFVLAVTAVELMEGGISKEVEAMIHTIVEMVSKAFLFLGIVLLFTPMRGLAIGLLIAGAIGLASESELDWETIVEELTTHLEDILSVISKYALIFGIILLFTPAKGLGIGLIALGAVVLVAQEMELDWETFVEELTTNFDKILEKIIPFSIILGIILLFTPAKGWGIGLLAAGAVFIVSQEIEIDWTTFTEELLTKLKEIFLEVMTYALFIGVILLFTPFKSLGVGLIVAGATGIIAEVTLDWNGLGETLQQQLTSILNIIYKFAFAIGVILLFSPQTMPLGLGLILLGGAGIFTTQQSQLDSSQLQEQMRSELQAVNNEAQRGVDEINNTLSSINFSSGSSFNASSYSSFGTNAIAYSVPRLAQGAVIPPNREFLAVLGDQKSGTNIEAPLATIEQAVSNVLSRQGNNGGGSSTVIMQIDGREFGRAVVEQGERENRRIGTKLVTIS